MSLFLCFDCGNPSCYHEYGTGNHERQAGARYVRPRLGSAARAVSHTFLPPTPVPSLPAMANALFVYVPHCSAGARVKLYWDGVSTDNTSTKPAALPIILSDLCFTRVSLDALSWCLHTHMDHCTLIYSLFLLLGLLDCLQPLHLRTINVIGDQLRLKCVAID